MADNSQEKAQPPRGRPPKDHERRMITAHKDDWARIEFVVARLRQVRAEAKSSRDA